MNKNILIVFLALIIGVLIYFQFKPREIKPSPVSIAPNVQTTPTNNQSNDNLKTYTANGFSFQYDKSATVKVESYGSGAVFYNVFKVEEVNEQIRLYDTQITSYESFCGKNIEIHTTTIQGKSFVYCDSKAEPARTYFYTKDNKTLIIMTQGTNGKTYSYIIPESVEIK